MIVVIISYRLIFGFEIKVSVFLTVFGLLSQLAEMMNYFVEAITQIAGFKSILKRADEVLNLKEVEKWKKC
jgi:hypothetical protein